ncbi:MAG: type II secretion system F family protein [Candidatus Limnocylindria bacterium]|nr:type II secretion system F family protein [Candidatus Limnocylindria bacterium]
MEALLLSVLVGVGVFFVFWSRALGGRLDPVQARLQQIAVRARNLEELELQRPISERTLKPIIDGLSRLVSRFYPANTVRNLQLKLRRAGMDTVAVEFFLGVKGFAALVGAVAGSAILNLTSNGDGTTTMLGIPLGLVLGFMAPDMYLGNKAGGRNKAILNALADALDLLTISVEAGLGFDAAIVKVTEKLKGPLSDEFKRAAGEQRVGKSRGEALRGIAGRVDVKEFKNFISAIIQADQLGVSMSKVLRIQSEQLRMERRQRAEVKAARAPILIMLPTIGCIFPSLFIVILGPAVLSAMATCGTV